MIVILKFFFFVFVVVVGIMVFDIRVGFYDDLLNKEIVRMIEVIKEVFKYLGKLLVGWEGLFFRFVIILSCRKYFEV